jgi:hypothetical protein
MRAAHIFLLGIGASEAVRLSGWRAPLCLSLEAATPAAALAALVRDVEREPELVPGVRHVRVLKRGEVGASRQTADASKRPWAGRPVCGTGLAPSGVWDGWVRYEVAGMFCGLRWTVRFAKAWEGDRRFVWHAEGGTGWPEQYGELMLHPNGPGTRMELRARTRSALPLLGGLGTLLVNPLFLAPAFSGWLRNLARAAEEETGPAT